MEQTGKEPETATEPLLRAILREVHTMRVIASMQMDMLARLVAGVTFGKLPYDSVLKMAADSANRVKINIQEIPTGDRLLDLVPLAVSAATPEEKAEITALHQREGQGEDVREALAQKVGELVARYFTNQPVVTLGPTPQAGA